MGPVLFGVLVLALIVESVSGMIGRIGGTWHHASPASYDPASARYDPFNDPSFKPPPVYIPPAKFEEEFRRAWKPRSAGSLEAEEEVARTLVVF